MALVVLEGSGVSACFVPHDERHTESGGPGEWRSERHAIAGDL